jgi:6-pyruvoyltetrahydropterin/6-carboxytetrahydropterin synthase
MKLTRRYKFSASHRLHAPSLSKAENAEIYGKCNNPYGHGHDYVLEVSVAGEIDEQTGRVVSPGELDAYVLRQVIRDFDHRDMNLDLPDFADGLVPTTENVAVVVNKRLRRDWPFVGVALDGVRLEETKRNSFELRSR